MLAKPSASGHPTAWENAVAYGGALPEATVAEPNARWAGVPDSLDTGRKLKVLEKAFAEYLYTTHRLSLWENRTLGFISTPGESKDTFIERCVAAAEEQKKQSIEMEKIKFRPKFESLRITLPGEKLAKTSAPTESDDSRLDDKRRKLKADYDSKVEEIGEKWKRIGKTATAIQLKPRKADVHVMHFGLGWAPHLGATPAY